MNCLTPRSGRRTYTEDYGAYYPPQPPYNPEFIPGNFESHNSCGTSRSFYYIQYLVMRDEDEDSTWRGRRSLYEGVNCMPVSAYCSDLMRTL